MVRRAVALANSDAVGRRDVMSEEIGMIRILSELSVFDDDLYYSG